MYDIRTTFRRKTTNLEFKVEQMKLENMLEETITFPIILHMIFDKFSAYTSLPR